MTPPVLHTKIQHSESTKISESVSSSTTQLDKNKAAATALLIRMSVSLKLEMSSQVDVTTIVTRTEQL